MSLERAEADLVKARAEMTRLRAQLEAASTKVLKLEHFIEVAKAYESDSNDDPAIGRSAGAALTHASIEIIRERGSRQKTTALVEELERRSHHIGGKNKVTNLSGALSRSADLTSNRTDGWGLAEWGENGVVPRPVTTNETAVFLDNIGAGPNPLPPGADWNAPPADLDDEIPF